MTTPVDDFEQTQLRSNACDSLQEMSVLYLHSLSSLETPAATRLKMMKVLSKTTNR